MTSTPYLCYIWNEDLLWLLSRCIQHFKFITKVTKQTWTCSIYICTDELQEKVKLTSIPKAAQAKGLTSLIQPCPRLAVYLLLWKPVRCTQATDYIAQHSWQTLNLHEHFWTPTQTPRIIQWNTATSTTVTFGLSMFFQNYCKFTVKTSSS